MSTTFGDIPRIFSLKINDSSEISSEFNNLFVSIASRIKELVVPSNSDRLRTFCDEKLAESTNFSIPVVGFEKVETYLKILILPRLLELTILDQDY